MKSSEQIVAYIDHYYSISLPRPRFHFVDAVNMESVLTRLEGLREYILDDLAKQAGWPEGYLDFMEEQGCGSWGIQGNPIPDEDNPRPIQSLEKNEKMEEFAKLWLKYLAKKRGFQPEELPD